MRLQLGLVASAGQHAACLHVGAERGAGPEVDPVLQVRLQAAHHVHPASAVAVGRLLPFLGLARARFVICTIVLVASSGLNAISTRVV